MRLPNARLCLRARRSLVVEGGDYALVAGKVAGKARGGEAVVKEASGQDERQSAEDTSEIGWYT